MLDIDLQSWMHFSAGHPVVSDVDARCYQHQNDGAFVNILTNNLKRSLCFCSLFHDGGPYHKETSPLICSAIRWTGFYMIRASVMKKLMVVVAMTLYSLNLWWIKGR